MRRRAAWLILILITILTGFSLFSTEVSYIRFIETLRAIKLTVQDAELNASHSEEALSVRFVLLFENPKGEKMFVEGIGYRLCLSDYEVSFGGMSGQQVLICPAAKFLGSYYTTEGEGLIPPQGRSVSLVTNLDHAYKRRFFEEQAAGKVSIHLVGEARIRLKMGKVEQFAKLPFREIIHE